MSTYLDTPFGGANTQKYSTGGLSRVWAAPFDKVVSKTTTLGAFGEVLTVTDIVMASGVTFVEIDCVEETASLLDGFKLTGSKKYWTPSVAFDVDAAGSVAQAKTNKLILTKKHILIVEHIGGYRQVVGLSNGLKATEVNMNSGAKADDASAATFLFAGINLGPAAELVMADADFGDISTPLA